MDNELKKVLIPVIVSGVLVLLGVAALMLQMPLIFWIIAIGLILYHCRPSAWMHRITMENATTIKKLVIVLVALVTIAACVLPMDQFPLWNGEIPGHRNQYELMAEAILEGRLDFGYGDEDSLAGLENPYDPTQREEAGVYYHWDHAYYNGKYYMYFGVVPVFLLFLPYRAVTGVSLTTYHGTQFFTAAAIAGIFALFYLLSKLFFKKLPFGVYLALSAAFSVMSVWYASAEPALYCTAITAALALEIWSIYFFVRAVWSEGSENKKILLAAVGALLGALVFGCRPPIALANVLVIPMLYVFLRQNKFTWKLLGKLVLAALPYAAVAAALMLYNYVRFDDPLQFGQAYQLTVADQTGYDFTLNSAILVNIFNNTFENLFGTVSITQSFPYLRHSSVYGNFPILLLTALAFRPCIRGRLRQRRLTPLLVGLLVSMVIITALDIMWTPYLLERYRMDIYFLAGIACFIVIGLWLHGYEGKALHRRSFVVILLAIATIAMSFLYCMRTISVYYPNWVADIGKQLTIG